MLRHATSDVLPWALVTFPHLRPAYWVLLLIFVSNTFRNFDRPLDSAAEAVQEAVRFFPIRWKSFGPQHIEVGPAAMEVQQSASCAGADAGYIGRSADQGAGCRLHSMLDRLRG